MRSTDAEGFFTRLLSLMREFRRQAGKRGASAGTGLTLLPAIGKPEQRRAPLIAEAARERQRQPR